MLLYKPIDSSSDYSSIQADLNAIYNRLSSKLLSLNPSKYKLMFFSHKPPPCPTHISLFKLTVVTYSASPSSNT